MERKYNSYHSQGYLSESNKLILNVNLLISGTHNTTRTFILDTESEYFDRKKKIHWICSLLSFGQNEMFFMQIRNSTWSWALNYLPWNFVECECNPHKIIIQLFFYSVTFYRRFNVFLVTMHLLTSNLHARSDFDRQLYRTKTFLGYDLQLYNTVQTLNQ